MDERFRRCRYWPDCEIHTGTPSKPRTLSQITDTERETIRIQYAAGLRALTASIAQAHGTDARAVGRILAGTRNVMGRPRSASPKE